MDFNKFTRVCSKIFWYTRNGIFNSHLNCQCLCFYTAFNLKNGLISQWFLRFPLF